jgi:hypothetical protein
MNTIMVEPLIPPLITQVVATVSGVIVSIGVPLIFTKLNKIDKLYTTVFGLQEVSSIGGLVNDVETNTGRLDKLEDGQDEIKEKIDVIYEEVNTDKN